MIIRKTISSLALGITCLTPLYAGTMGEVSTAPSYKGIYVEGNVGYANHPWIADRTTTPGLENQLGVLTNLSNINGGTTAGVDAGYQFTSNFALEGGWLYLPTASYNRDTTVHLTIANTTYVLPEGLQVNINSNLGYLAVKGMVPIYDRFSAFAKLGAAYTRNTTNVNVPSSSVASVTPYTTTHSNFWNPILAFGAQYSTLNNILFNFQYGYVPGYRSASTSSFIAPVVQTFTFGLGYKFSL